LGNSYASGKGTCFNPGGGENSLGKARKEAGVHPLDRLNVSDLQKAGLKPKDLVGIPWMVAFALRADGWYLRSDIIWAKPNPMPESVNGWRWEHHRVKVDGEWKHCPGCEKCLTNERLVLKKGSWRPTKSHEYVFMFTKSDRYYADGNAIREPALWERWGKQTTKKNHRNIKPVEISSLDERRKLGRNRRSVWTIPTKGFPGQHFAVFPEALVEPMMLASCPERVCKSCGKPEVAVIEDTVIDVGKKSQDKTADCVGTSETSALRFKNKIVERKITGYRPTCKCNAGFEPGIILDPFCGSGTTCVVAKRLGRNYVAIELNSDYVRMAEERVRSAEAEIHPELSGSSSDLSDLHPADLYPKISKKTTTDLCAFFCA
jgi:DNA modification methylase